MGGYGSRGIVMLVYGGIGAELMGISGWRGGWMMGLEEDVGGVDEDVGG